jgi:hypothetical protein
MNGFIKILEIQFIVFYFRVKRNEAFMFDFKKTKCSFFMRQSVYSDG